MLIDAIPFLPDGRGAAFETSTAWCADDVKAAKAFRDPPDKSANPSWQETLNRVRNPVVHAARCEIRRTITDEHPIRRPARRSRSPPGSRIMPAGDLGVGGRRPPPQGGGGTLSVSASTSRDAASASPASSSATNPPPHTLSSGEADERSRRFTRREGCVPRSLADVLKGHHRTRAPPLPFRPATSPGHNAGPGAAGRVQMVMGGGTAALCVALGRNQSGHAAGPPGCREP
jgi:hypothetical protein